MLWYWNLLNTKNICQPLQLWYWNLLNSKTFIKHYSCDTETCWIQKHLSNITALMLKPVNTKQLLNIKAVILKPVEYKNICQTLKLWYWNLLNTKTILKHYSFDAETCWIQKQLSYIKALILKPAENVVRSQLNIFWDILFFIFTMYSL